MWRPKKGWKNPYYKTEEALGTEIAWNEYPQFEIYEAGADAILEELLSSDNVIAVSETAITMPGFMTNLDDYVRSLRDGTWVFIPDEDE